MWKCLKSFVNGGCRSKNNQGIVFNGMLESENRNIAEKFNVYFLDSISAIAKDINRTEVEEILSNIKTPEKKFTQFKTLQMADLKKVVKNLKNKPSSVDGVNSTIKCYHFK